VASEAMCPVLTLWDGAGLASTVRLRYDRKRSRERGGAVPCHGLLLRAAASAAESLPWQQRRQVVEEGRRQRGRQACSCNRQWLPS
jgi:hypothetical protein